MVIEWDNHGFHGCFFGIIMLKDGEFDADTLWLFNK